MKNVTNLDNKGIGGNVRSADTLTLEYLDSLTQVDPGIRDP